MKFSYNWLQDYITKKLPTPQKLADLLTMHSFEVEDIKREKGGWILDIDILPNRAPDALSHIGAAREISALLRASLKMPTHKIAEARERAGDILSVKVSAPELCPRYTARVVRGVKIGPSPKWLRNRLEILGLKSVNNVVDITNYIMLATGQPLHAFDLEKIKGGLVVRRAKKGEIITTLDDETYILDPSMLVIADAKEPLAVAGIKGGKKAEITQNSKDIVLESANFAGPNIRYTARFLGLHTDSSYRFEHRLPLSFAPWAINLAADMIKGIAGGEIAGGVIDIQSRRAQKRVLRVPLDKIYRVFGGAVKKQEIIDILQRLEFKIMPERENVLKATAPSFRLDIERVEDIAEEVGRIYGWRKITPVLPHGALVPPPLDNRRRWTALVKEILRGFGFTETYLYSFLSEEQLARWSLAPDTLYAVENPVSRDFAYLRPALIYNLADSAAKNLRFFKEVRMYELGHVFDKKQASPTGGQGEKNHLAFVVAGRGSKQDMFYEAKGAVLSLLNKLGIAEGTISVKINEVGEGLPGGRQGIMAAELDFDQLLSAATEEQIYTPAPKYPAVHRDISILAPRDVRIGDALRIIHNAGGRLLVDVDLFDFYEGENIKEGKKSIAFHLMFRSDTKTLQDKEVDGIMARIEWMLEHNKGWEVRK